ncbi:MAG: Protein of unknown function (DUF3727) [Phormidesmis priestleyi Ana]|uniref:DUF3727 domain-containing protein n=1 Tax=Phormidesmis priestleyi Ana TaxID=1666911 RepID=A0A0P7ZZ73_9CYAN|nr:MAG: Protein of unknown function (DUF3727) [Phormidesmis priestleyi Ana]
MAFDPNLVDEPAEYPVVTLTDEEGRKLACYVEKSLDVDGAEFLLLLPVDLPIEIFVWQSDEDAEEGDEEILVDVEDDDIDDLFPSARAVLAELNLTLERSAHTLTAAGDLPEADEEDCFSLEISEDDGEPMTEDFQMLATFFHNESQYTLCTPLEPLLFFATREADGTVELVDPEDFQKMRSQLEDKLFDVLD